MIIEITNDNLYLLEKNDFLNRKKVEEELRNNPFAKFLVLIEEEQIIGYIYYSDIYERAEINQFEISFLNRNCGKGKKLLQEMIMRVDKDITLEVREDNLPAIKVYKDLGFVEKAIRKNYYNGKDGILMERVK